MKKYILVGKCFTSVTGGPTGIIRELSERIKKHDVEYTPLLYTEKDNKIKFIIKLFKTCLKEKEAVINVHTDGYLFPVIVYLCSVFNKKSQFYLTVHGLYKIESKYTGKTKKRYLFIEKKILTKFPNLICVSDMLKNNIADLFCRSDNILVIPNATDACSNKIPQKDSDIKIIFLGGLRERKGITTNLQLFSELKKKGICFKAFLYGINEQSEESFRDTINKLDLSEQVFYMGLETNREFLYDTVASSDVQLCISEYDTFNVAIIESLTLGCPVIASDMCGASYLVADDAGIVISVNEELKTGFSKSIDYIINVCCDWDKRLEVYNNRQYYSNKLSWDSVAKRYLNL